MTTYSKPAMDLKVDRAVQDTKYLMREEIFRLRTINAELVAALERIAEASSERSDGIGSASILSGIARAAIEKARTP